MRQLKLRRTLTRLNKTKDKPPEMLKSNDKAKLIEQVTNPMKIFIFYSNFYSL